MGPPVLLRVSFLFPQPGSRAYQAVAGSLPFKKDVFLLKGEELIINEKKSSGTICILGLLRKQLSNRVMEPLWRGRLALQRGKPDE